MFSVSAEISGLARKRSVTVDFLVDADSAYSSMPASLLRGVGVDPTEERTFISDGYGARGLGVGQAWMRIGDREEASNVVFAEEDWQPKIGHVTLGQFCLGIAADGKSLEQVLPRMCNHGKLIND